MRQGSRFAYSQSSRRNGPPALPPRPSPMPEPPKPAGTQTRRPMPDLGSHSDRLREMLNEIETAAARARDRSRTRPGRKP